MEILHQKHAQIVKANGGKFGRNEIALVGAPCELIQNIAKDFVESIATARKVTYVDADHSLASDVPFGKVKSVEFTDKISFKRLDFPKISDFQQRFLLNEQDLILINGNHFEGNKQLVFIHPKKEESLHKRFLQLTNIIGFVLCEDATQPYEWLEDEGRTIQHIPVLSLADTAGIHALLKANCSVPVVKGLVLVGGKSTRMGIDKSKIAYHGKSQREYLFETLATLGVETFVSVRQECTTETNFPAIEDAFTGLGPYGAILSAFRHDPNAAWLIVACDMPFLTETVFEELLSNRNPYKLATAFLNPETAFPDPLLTIYEPKAYQVLLNFLALGYSCPRKMLINSDIQLLETQHPFLLKNVNTPQEKEEAMAALRS